MVFSRLPLVSHGPPAVVIWHYRPFISVTLIPKTVLPPAVTTKVRWCVSKRDNLRFLLGLVAILKRVLVVVRQR